MQSGHLCLLGHQLGAVLLHASSARSVPSLPYRPAMDKRRHVKCIAIGKCNDGRRVFCILASLHAFTRACLSSLVCKA